MTESSSPRLILCDAMLGKLARWLRLIGYDTRFIADTDDLVLVRVARAEGRLLLTRDLELTRRKGIETLYIDSLQVDEQMKQLLDHIGLPPADAPARCPECNTVLDDLPGDQAQDRVPPYVWRTHDHFTHCPDCHRVYWKGTHWQAIQKQIDAYQGR